MKKNISLIAFIVVVAATLVVFIANQMVKSLGRSQGNVPIVFYGRLVDQNGSGVPNATIVGEVHGIESLSAPVPGGINVAKRSVSTRTDSNGNFTLDAGDGASVGLSADAPGYIGDCGGWYFFSTAHTAIASAYRSDPTHPEIFKFWKLRGNNHLTENHLRVHIQADGQKYTIDLVKGEAHEGGDRVGDLRISLSVPVQTAGAAKVSWTFKADAIDGGFVHAADRRIHFEAPVDGYIPSLSFDMTNHNIAMALLGEYYYLKSRSGAVYAAISMDPNTTNEPIFDITYRVNTAGSRLLEP